MEKTPNRQKKAKRLKSIARIKIKTFKSNIMRKSKTIAILLMTLFGLSIVKAQTKIPPGFFGINYWGANYRFAPSHTFSPSQPAGLSTISTTSAKMMRVGGTAFTVRYKSSQEDRSFPIKTVTIGAVTNTETVPNSAGYVKIVDDVRAAGFEPQLTVPVDDRSKTRSIEEQALQAADIVRTVNKIHKRNVKYWIIGNEPEVSQSYGNLPQPSQMEHVRRYILVFSQMMKDVDPDILIIGPENNFANTAFFNYLITPTTNPSSILGNHTSSGSSNGKPIIDFLSYHSYGGFSEEFVANNSSSNTTPYNNASRRQRYAEAGHNLFTSYQEVYDNYLKTNRPGMKIIINEFNMHNTDIASASTLHTTQDQSDVTSGQITGDDYNGNTFLAGQFIVDQMAAMLSTTVSGSNENAYAHCNIWSIKEDMNYGLLHGNNLEKKPTFWHFWLMSKYFNGTFFSNKQTYPSIGDPTRCIKAYACRAENYIAVLVTNQSQSTSTVDAATFISGAHSFTIDFGSGPNISFGMGLFASHIGTIAPQSTQLLFFNCSGTSLTGKYEFNDAWVANNLTASSPPWTSGTSTTAPTPNALVLSGNACFSSSVTASISAPTSCTWFKAPDLTNAIATATSAINTYSPGLYYAKFQSSCSTTIDIWLPERVNDQSPIISRLRENFLGCAGGGNTIEIQNTGFTYSWSPPTVNIGGSYYVSATPMPTIPTVYSVTASNNSCITTETLNLLVNYPSGSNMMFVRDLPNDTGVNGHTNTAVYDSPDIFLSTTPGGIAIPTATYVGNDIPHYMNIVVHNTTNSQSVGILRAYWAKFGIGQSWPDEWVNKPVPSTYTSGTHTMVLGADMIGTPISITVAANTTTTFSLPWVVPNPGIFQGFVGTNNLFHFCVIANIETGCYPLPNNIYLPANVCQSPQWAWKNFSVLLNEYQRQFDWDPESTVLKGAKKPRGVAGGDPKGIMKIQLQEGDYNTWVANSSGSSGVAPGSSNRILVTDSVFTIKTFTSVAAECSIGEVMFTYTTQPDPEDSVDIYLEQWDLIKDSLVGGLHILVVPRECPRVELVNRRIELPPYCLAEMEVSEPDGELQYDWYDETGTYIESGHGISAPAHSNTYFIVKAAANGCEISDTCFILMEEGHPCQSGRYAEITGLQNIYGSPEGDIKVYPNPTRDRIHIVYGSTFENNSRIEITNLYGQVIYQSNLAPGTSEHIADCNSFIQGLYFITISSQEGEQRTTKFVVDK